MSESTVYGIKISTEILQRAEKVAEDLSIVLGLDALEGTRK